MRVTKREDFALIFMGVLANNNPDKYISLSLVAKETHLSPLFLKHIAYSLLEKNLIESKEGISGGYRLAKDPKDITVDQIIEAVSKDVITISCKQGVCRLKNRGCSCSSFWNKVNQKLSAYLGKVTLWEFAHL